MDSTNGRYESDDDGGKATSATYNINNHSISLRILHKLLTIKMAIVNRYVSSSHPESLKALKALAAVVGLEDSVSFGSESAEGEYAVKMNTTVNTAFGTTKTHSVSGFVDCARQICNAVPESGFWTDDSNVQHWVEEAAKALLAPAYVLSSDQVMDVKSQVHDFLSAVETQLSDTKQVLVGDDVTAADIIASILIAEAVSRVTIDIPLKVQTFMKIILSNEVISTATGGLTVPSTDVSENAVASSDFSLNKVIQKLNEMSISHDTYSHKLSMKVEELLENVPLPAGETHTKNVFFKDKKHGMFLVSTLPNADVNTKELAKLLGLQGKVNMRLSTEEQLMESLGVKPGCVGPLSILNNTAKDVTVVLDEGLFADNIKKIHSHPLTNDVSTAVSPVDLKKYFEALGIEPAIVSFSTKSDQGGKAPANRPPQTKTAKGEQQTNAGKQKGGDKKATKKGETLLALQWKKDENFPQWYSDVIVLSEMIAYYDISGCYILRPWSYKIWDIIQNWFNIEIEKLDVENSYFPLFVSQDRLEKEKDHVEGFAPEVAWVTKSGDAELAKPIAIRPTSETIMYPAFSDWIKSHRDLPLKLNQWSNVVRWEFKYPTPFLRSREFLWQEGHTAHASYEDANVMVRQALELYRRVYEELLAVPVVPGYKTEEEKFAGGFQTTTVEAYIAGSGRAIQGATSHNLGQNFGKMFDIKYQDETGKTQIAWQTSWGLTTRTIGVMVMVHGDDKGLVLPPRISPLQVVIVPIISKKLTSQDAKPYCEALLKELKDAGVRVKLDDRDMYNPGWKYNHWEQKGVPLRLEVGPRDIETRQVRIVTRFNGDKEDISIENIGITIRDKLEAIQDALFAKAVKARDEHLVKVTEWKDFVPNLEKNNLILTPWCGGEHKDWEEYVKDKSREESLASRGEVAEDEKTATSVAAKTLCIPFNQPELPEGTKCFASGLPATCWVLWGRSY